MKYGLIYDGTSDAGSVFIDKKVSAPMAFSEDIVIKPYVAYHVYESGKTQRHTRGIFRSILLFLSTGLIAVSTFGFLILFWPVLVQELRYNLILSHQSSAADETFGGFPKGEKWSPPNTTFSIVVPKIDAKAPIIANVEASAETEYMEALKKGVAQAKGTCFPGMDCAMYLFAHSAGSPLSAARYNAVFYLLKKLDAGDQLIIYYYGKKILYEVTGKEIVTPEDTKYITEKGTEERLILQTCDPPGTTLNRLLVFAKPKLVEYLK